MTLDLHTSRFAAVNQHLKGLYSVDQAAYVPVRTSLGTPRFIPGARDWPYASLIAPAGLLKLAPAAFEAAYFAHLDNVGLDRINAQLMTIAATNPGRPLLLLCYEDLAKAPCHRRMFAAWYAAKTGVVIPETAPTELGERPLPPREGLIGPSDMVD